jgi:AcrR family transcriptional regulator
VSPDSLQRRRLRSPSPGLPDLGQAQRDGALPRPVEQAGTIEVLDIFPVPKQMSANQRERRASILKVAIELLDAREYEQVQVREIAEAAGVALATLYRYFPSKEQLYANAFFAWGAPYGDQVRARRGRAATDEARLQSAIRRSLRAYEQNPRFYRVITGIQVGTDRVASELMSRFGERYRDVLADVMQDTHQEDARRVALIVVGTLDNLLRKWSTGDLSMREVYREIEAIIALVFARPRSKAAGAADAP